MIQVRSSARGPFGVQGIDVLLGDQNSPFINRTLGVASRFQGLAHALPVMQIGIDQGVQMLLRGAWRLAMEHCEAPWEGKPEPLLARGGQSPRPIRKGRPKVCSISQPAHLFLIKPSLSRQFELEAQSRAIQGCTDIEELRGVAMSLLKAWHMQAEMTKHFGAQAMGQTARIKS